MNQKLKRYPVKIILIFSLSMLFLSCEKNYAPKPRGYFRIDLPEHHYKTAKTENCNYSFQYSSSAVIVQDKNNASEPCWFNIYYPKYKALVHLSYKPVKEGNVNEYIEDSRTLVYKHTVKASDISEKLIINSDAQVFGLLYELEGNAASSMQFYVTDSTSNFLRGALYFNIKPNPDSIAPVEKYIQQDIHHFIKTFSWK